MEALLNRDFLDRMLGRINRVYDKVLIVGEEVVSTVPLLKSRIKEPVPV